MMTSKTKSISARITEGAISAETSDYELAQDILEGNIVILKNAFLPDEARQLRDSAFNWGRSQTPSAPADFYALKNDNHFCTHQGVSNGQKTLHYYHSYNFNNFTRDLPDDLTRPLTRFCSHLRELYNRITGNRASFAGDPRLHPQIIHYPSGAGFFAKHTHLLEPQKIGTITALSQPGLEYTSGSVGFEVSGELVDIAALQDIGDVTLFRFDLPHWVTPVDIEDRVDRDSSRGRWVLTLSYY